jgi:hypothetical protein
MADGTTGIPWRGASAQRTGRPGPVGLPPGELTTSAAQIQTLLVGRDITGQSAFA